ncbi:hypothetical protein FOZ63_018351, partial [Perkinsus olseni]
NESSGIGEVGDPTGPASTGKMLQLLLLWQTWAYVAYAIRMEALRHDGLMCPGWLCNRASETNPSLHSYYNITGVRLYDDSRKKSVLITTRGDCMPRLVSVYQQSDLPFTKVH